jgi:membrane-bound lytic murein transglycosylase MltF
MFGVIVRSGLVGVAITLSLTDFMVARDQLTLPSVFIQTPATPVEKKAAKATGALELPPSFDRHVGDLDDMAKRHQIRALVVPSRSGFFYDKGHPRGIFYEAMEEFQRFANQKLKTGVLKIHVIYIPVKPEQLESSLLNGVGDVIAYGAIVTPEREKLVLFTTPIAANVKEVIVTGPKAPPMATLQDLSGRVVYVNPLTVYFDTLKSFSESFVKAGKAPIIIKAADPNLTDEDLLEMVSAGMIPATVTINVRYQFWSEIFPNLTSSPDMVLKEEGQLAFPLRMDSPKLQALFDEFIQSRRLGTAFGNILVRRYLQNTKWVKNATSSEEMKKFQTYVVYFKKYAAQYDFDYLMLVAQGYQESLLDQSRKNSSGAVGIMQVIPKYAAAPPINIPNVDSAERNIEAGAKMMHHISQTYFQDTKLDNLNRTLMTFASYNAGPNRIARLRKKTASDGLDPNLWFGNVELVVAKDVGQETVRYVSNIYKYYVAYKLTLEPAEFSQ